jgi:hypothetical protein
VPSRRIYRNLGRASVQVLGEAPIGPWDQPTGHVASTRRWPGETTCKFVIMKTHMSLAALALLFLSVSAGATSICRWVNESGRTQIAEGVPEKY